MNPFLKKEIRLLVPAFLFALAIALVSIFFHGENGGWLNGVGYFLDCIFFPAVVIMLALNSFGTEVGTQMFAMMLAQPVERQRVWQTKIVLLIVAMAAIAVIWAITAIVPAIYFQHNFTLEDQANAVAVVVLFGLVVFSGALWTVLLLRQVAAAFWFTLLIPGALLGITAAACSGSSDEFMLGMTTVVLGLYSLAGFFFARWLFFRAQDLQWTGGTIVMPEWRGLRRFLAQGEGVRVRRPWVALWLKEIQLHQSQWVIAFVLAVLHLGVLAVREFCNLDNSHDLKAILEGFWVLWLLMPLLVGCAAVAEERKLGVHEGQLCLPINRKTEFIIKLVVALGLSIVLGMVMPVVLELNRFLSNYPSKPEDWLILPMIPAVICFIAFYISSMARNTIQTLAPSLLGIVFIWPFVFLSWQGFPESYDFFWRGPLGCIIGLPLIAITLAVLAYSNFQRVITGWQLVGRNVLTIACAIFVGTLLTSAVYHRFWEKLTPFEPSHGTPRLSLSQPAILDASWTGSLVILPGGKVWAAPVVVKPSASKTFKSTFGNFKVSTPDGKFYPDTNWLTLVKNFSLVAGIKNDGTLWISRKPLPPDLWIDEHNAIIQDRLESLTQYGSQSNWSSVCPWGRTVLLVKKDGTLWRLGQDREDKSHELPPFQSLTPNRLGTGSDWASVGRCGWEFCFFKQDGSAWTMGNWTTNHQAYFKINPDFIVHAVPPLDNHQMRSVAMISHGLPFWVGIRRDGTFRIWGHERLSTANHGNYEWSLTDLQIGHDTNWVALAYDGSGHAITLKRDGTLWLWNFQKYPIAVWNPEVFDGEVARTVPVQLGSHSDWISISDDFALAADGSLWYWPTVDARELSNMLGLDRNEPDGQNHWAPLIDISRKPQRLGNIFSAAN